MLCWKKLAFWWKNTLSSMFMARWFKSTRARVVTTFEFRPDAGVKYSRVVGLQDDLCLAMRAESILIERMPGKSTVGLQVPNIERETIWLRDMIEADSFTHSKSGSH